MKTFKEFADEFIQLKPEMWYREQQLIKHFEDYLLEHESIMWDDDLCRYVPTNYHYETMDIFNRVLEADLNDVLDMLAKQRGYGDWDNIKDVLRKYDIVLYADINRFIIDTR